MTLRCTQDFCVWTRHHDVYSCSSSQTTSKLCLVKGCLRHMRAKHIVSSAACADRCSARDRERRCASGAAGNGQPREPCKYVLPTSDYVGDVADGPIQPTVPVVLQSVSNAAYGRASFTKPAVSSSSNSCMRWGCRGTARGLKLCCKPLIRVDASPLDSSSLGIPAALAYPGGLSRAALSHIHHLVDGCRSCEVGAGPPTTCIDLNHVECAGCLRPGLSVRGARLHSRASSDRCASLARDQLMHLLCWVRSCMRALRAHVRRLFAQSCFNHTARVPLSQPLAGCWAAFSHAACPMLKHVPHARAKWATSRVDTLQGCRSRHSSGVNRLVAKFRGPLCVSEHARPAAAFSMR